MLRIFVYKKPLRHKQFPSWLTLDSFCLFLSALTYPTPQLFPFRQTMKENSM